MIIDRNLSELLDSMNGTDCPCEKSHALELMRTVFEHGAIDARADSVRIFAGRHILLVSDNHTDDTAGFAAKRFSVKKNFLSHAVFLLHTC